jgi:hypothetical protein
VVTRAALKDEKGRLVPATTGDVRGRTVEILVAGEHVIFKEFDRDIRDVALMHGASVIGMLANSDASVSAVYGELVMAIADLKVSPTLIIERIVLTFDRIRRLMMPVISADPEPFWALLSAEHKQYVEQAGALELADTPMAQLVADGRFISFCPGGGLIQMIEDRPAPFFEGQVFRPSLLHRPEEATQRIVRKLTQAIATLNTFVQDDLMRQKDDIRLAQIYLDLLDDQLSSEEWLN